MALYEFNPDDAHRFARERGIRTFTRGDELIFKTCPYCGGETGKKDKFAINLRTGAFNCLRASCGAKGNMLTLHRDFNFDLGQNVSEYEKPKETWKRFSREGKEPFPTTDAAVEYLHGKRGISEEVIKRYEVRTKEDDPNVLIFYFYGEDKKTVELIKYRAIKPDPRRGKEWSEEKMRSILFGIKQCEDFGTLIITEGQIDSLSVATAGFPNAVSVPTGKKGMRWVPHNWDWVKKFKKIIVFGDYENGEMTLLPDIQSRFESEDCVVCAVRPEDYRGCKDANEILMTFGADQIRTCVNNAAPVMLEQVKRLYDVQYEDEGKKEYLPTGITELDKLLNGGLRFGYLDILTGKRGEGKSTLGSMLTKAALESGYTCFIYSGEMRTQEVRRWLDYQIAGQDKIEHNQIGNVITHRVKDAFVRTIWDWYKDTIYTYDTSYVGDEEHDLIDTVERYIKHFGCRFVLLDNLMTAMDITEVGETDDRYDKQSRICKKLARIAQKYNALILLVAHKKKSNAFDKDENDDVLGSSEITNLAGVVMSYGRGKDIDESQRLLKVSKNRETGDCNFKGILLNFDPASKRIFGNTEKEMDGPKRPSKCFDEFVPVSAEDSPDIPF